MPVSGQAAPSAWAAKLPGSSHRAATTISGILFMLPADSARVLASVLIGASKQPMQDIPKFWSTSRACVLQDLTTGRCISAPI